MKEKNTSRIENVKLLRAIRDKLLIMHKNLVDLERENYELRNGAVSGGQFLQLLLKDENFAWLRKFSTLIVEVDEMFSVNDSFTNEMLERHFAILSELVNFQSNNKDFNEKYRKVLLRNESVKKQHQEIKKLLEKQCLS